MQQRCNMQGRRVGKSIAFVMLPSATSMSW